MPRNLEARKTFVDKLRHQFAWPDRWVSGVVISFGIFTALGTFLAFAIGLIGLPVLLFTLGLAAVYLAWGFYHFFKGKVIITLDGPDLNAKQDMGMALAEHYGYTYVDMAVVYRALALKAIKDKLNLKSPETIRILAETRIDFQLDNRLGRLRVYMDDEDITREVLTPLGKVGFQKIVGVASRLGQIPDIEKHLVNRLEQMSRQNNLVVVGQNMGLMLDKRAKLKLYVTGGLKARAEQL